MKKKKPNIHFIAIGGAVMHNLAIALHLKGYQITGSDDEIFEPSKSRLKNYGLLPEKYGWDPERIHTGLDAIILGMHAKADNIELRKAIDLKLPVYSFPEFLYEQTKNKKRIVIAGSHGKTTITSMILHVLKTNKIKFDYMVGSQIAGFETMVGLENNSELAVFEGDEYLTSPLDRQPKFLHYHPDITLISGIAWDHMNVYPDYKDYVSQFELLCQNTNPEGHIFYYGNDTEISGFIGNKTIQAGTQAYYSLNYSIKDTSAEIQFKDKKFRIDLIGRYNIENLTGAMMVCRGIGIPEEEFLQSMTSFTGSSRRQELIQDNPDFKVYRDFAHAPSKVKATVDGFKEQFPEKKIIAFLELHTFSSLNKSFLPHYQSTLNNADQAYVFFDPEVVKAKKLPELSPDFVQDCFANPAIRVITDSKILSKMITESKKQGNIVLLMSSGYWGGIDIPG